MFNFLIVLMFILGMKWVESLKKKNLKLFCVQIKEIFELNDYCTIMTRVF